MDLIGQTGATRTVQRGDVHDGDRLHVQMDAVGRGEFAVAQRRVLGTVLHQPTDRAVQ